MSQERETEASEVVLIGRFDPPEANNYGVVTFRPEEREYIRVETPRPRFAPTDTREITWQAHLASRMAIRLAGEKGNPEKPKRTDNGNFELDAFWKEDARTAARLIEEHDDPIGTMAKLEAMMIYRVASAIPEHLSQRLGRLVNIREIIAWDDGSVTILEKQASLHSGAITETRIAESLDSLGDLAPSLVPVPGPDWETMGDINAYVNAIGHVGHLSAAAGLAGQNMPNEYRPYSAHPIQTLADPIAKTATAVREQMLHNLARHYQENPDAPTRMTRR